MNGFVDAIVASRFDCSIGAFLNEKLQRLQLCKTLYVRKRLAIQWTKCLSPCEFKNTNNIIRWVSVRMCLWRNECDFKLFSLLTISIFSCCCRTVLIKCFHKIDVIVSEFGCGVKIVRIAYTAHNQSMKISNAVHERQCVTNLINISAE